MTTTHDEIIRAIGDVKTQVAAVSGKVDAVAADVTELKTRSNRDSGRINDLEAKEDKREGRNQLIKWAVGSGFVFTVIGAIYAWFQDLRGGH